MAKAKAYTLVKRYENFQGLDLQSSNITRDPEACSDGQNCQFLSKRTLTSRKGYKAISPSQAGYGMAKYVKTSATDGSQTVEILTVGSQLYRQTTGTIAMTYSGSADSVLCSVLVDSSTSTWHFYLYEDGVTTLDYDMGVGFDEASIKTVADLVTAIDALTDFAATGTGDTAVPCAMIPSAYKSPFTSGALTITFNSWEVVNQPSTAANPFATLHTNVNSAYFRNISSANLNNVIYLASGYDSLVKYDGQKAYKAGMPQPSAAPSVSSGGAGNVDIGTHYYIATYIQYDKQNNIVEGIESDPGSFVVSAAAKIASITVTNIQDTTGYNTDMARVNGAQSGVTTVTVDSGHTLKIGDVAYFYDGATSAYVTRTITAKTSTSITFAGSVNVADNAVISANLRIAIYGTVAGGTDYYLIAEIPNDSANATQVYTWDTADATLILGAQYLFPIVPHGLPPAGRYITIHQGQLVISGILDRPNDVEFSDIDSPEYFYTALNSFKCQTLSANPITGIHPVNEFLIVWKQHSYFVVSGTLADYGFRVDLVSSDVGCVAHAAATDINGNAVFLSTRGPMGVGPNGKPLFIGEAVSSLFTTAPIDSDHMLMPERAFCLNDANEQLCIFFVPTETTTSSKIAVNNNMLILVWDYVRESWLPLWTNMNMGGGAVIDEDDLYFIERRYSTYNSALAFNLYKRLNNDDQYDYVDHIDPIDWRYQPGWEALGEPSVYKKFLRIKMFCTDPNFSPDFSLRVRTEVDYQGGNFKTDTTMDFGSGMGGSGWSVTPWGDLWGDPQTPAVVKKLKSGRWRSLRYYFSHADLYKFPIITGWETEMVAPFRPEIKT